MFQIYVRPEKAAALTQRHPWVWSRSIIEPAIAPEAGSVVDLVTSDGRWLGRGIYNPASQIRVRMYAWNESQQLDETWLRSKLENAGRLRDQWQQVHGSLDAVRLVNSEGDGLSGLVVERFGKYGVIQATAAGVTNWLPTVSQWLMDRYQLDGVWLRVDEKMAEAEGMAASQSLLRGGSPTGPVVIDEFGVKIELDIVAGQKTGYYLDQRANRRRAAAFMRGRMLDVCTYLGGFALNACRHGDVSQVTAIDMSAKALAQAQRNAELNGCSQRIQFVQADCFEELDRMRKEGQQFDSIVLDPPRLAGTRESKPAALRAYHRLNALAMQLLSDGGALVTCSCSGRVSREEFLQTLASSARRANRRFQIISDTGADFDHPWDVACPEGEYLKCIIGRVSSSM